MKSLSGWLVLAVVACLVLPWHAQDGGLWSGEGASLLRLVVGQEPGMLWLTVVWPVVAGLVACLRADRRAKGAALCALAVLVLAGMAWMGGAPCLLMPSAGGPWCLPLVYSSC
jgi:putative copper export protein